MPTLDANEASFRERLNRIVGDAYEVGDLIGRSSCWAVYGAWDTKEAREVAIRAGRHPMTYFTDAQLARIAAVGDVLTRLRHPCIVPTHVVGVAEDLLYVVVDKVEGESLRDCLYRERSLSAQETVRVLWAVASALEAAHTAGVVHILALYDRGEADGQLYYTMPFVEGESLRATSGLPAADDGTRGRGDRVLGG